jgi:hypothetical protein
MSLCVYETTSVTEELIPQSFAYEGLRGFGIPIWC